MATVRDVAKYFKSTDRWIRMLVRREILPRARGGGYDLSECAEGFVRHAHAELRRRGIDPDDRVAMERTIEGTNALRRSRRRLIEAQAARAELKFRLQSGVEIPLSLFEYVMSDAVLVTRNLLLNVADRESAQLVGLDERKILEHLRSVFEDAAKPIRRSGTVLKERAAQAVKREG